MRTPGRGANGPNARVERVIEFPGKNTAQSFRMAPAPRFRPGRAVLTLLVVSLWLEAPRASGSAPVTDADLVPTEPIRVEGGLIVGERHRSPDGLEYYRGIPYAAPPVGQMRWRPPEPVIGWSGVRECIRFGDACPQPRIPIRGLEILEPKGEDCLFVNITKAIAGGSGRPVMVWIHGGAFLFGSGAQAMFDPTEFARKGAIVVTINYRLGIFGYLAHPALSRESERGVSGNYGLWDQIAALRWVRENIAAFGGNRDNITVFGHAAGATSIACLLVSPLAQGLFHRAIAQSSQRLDLRHLGESRHGYESMEEYGTAWAERMGIPAGTDVAALRSKSASAILANTPDLSGGRLSFQEPLLPLGPIVDGWLIPDDPDKLLAAGKVTPVPLVVGFNRHESAAFLLRGLPASDPAGFRTVALREFGSYAEALLRLYPIDAQRDLPTAIGRIVTDLFFVAPARRLARALTQVQAPVFFYEFSNIPDKGIGRLLGAYHGAEIPYVFEHFSDRHNPGPADRALAARMNGAWVAFARSGDPNGAPASRSPTWPQFGTAEHYLDLGATVQARRAPRAEACDFWDEIESAWLRRPRPDPAPVFDPAAR